LGGGIHVPQVGFQDPDQSVLILSLADKVLEFVTQCFDFFVTGGFADGGHAVVQQLGDRRIALEEISVFHHGFTPLCNVIGTAR